MGLRPTQVMKNALRPATALPRSFALPFVIPTEAKRSGGICSSTDLSWKCVSQSAYSTANWMVFIEVGADGGSGSGLRSRVGKTENCRHMSYQLHHATRFLLI